MIVMLFLTSWASKGTAERRTGAGMTEANQLKIIELLSRMMKKARKKLYGQNNFAS
jgi:hypothetical protein